MINNVAWTHWITWGLIIGGWLYTHYKNRQLETRKEVHQTISKISASLAEICDEAIKFHTNEKFCGATIFQALFKFEDETSNINLLVDILKLDSCKIGTLTVGLRRSISLKNADKSSFKQQSYDSGLLKKITHGRSELDQYLKKQYYVKYFS